MKGDNHFMITKDDNLKAVYSSDLDSFLGNLGMAETLHTGEMVCRYCKSTIGEENLYAIIPVNGKTEFCCNQPKCVLSLSEEANK